MLIEIHMLKNYAPSNLNRDDTGAPKTCVFGGIQRGRISSQCLKRSWRKSEVFESELQNTAFGVRTRKLPELVAEFLREDGIDAECIEHAKSMVSGLGNKDGKENKKDTGATAQIAYYSPEDIRAIADAVKSMIAEDKEKFKKKSGKDLQGLAVLKKARPITLDIALFGRMITSDAFKDVEAAMQVAHAISTNRVVMESDYYTAMDDLIDGSSEEAGAGMIGDTDYNSNCYYMYASLNVDALRKNLAECEDVDALVKKAVPAILRTMAFANPTGKQNSFAGHALPSAVYVECKDRPVPVSYANAFVKAVSSDKSGDIVCNSISALANEIGQVEKDFGKLAENAYWFCTGKYAVKPEGNVTVYSNFNELVEAVSETV